MRGNWILVVLLLAGGVRADYDEIGTVPVEGWQDGDDFELDETVDETYFEELPTMGLDVVDPVNKCFAWNLAWVDGTSKTFNLCADGSGIGGGVQGAFDILRAAIKGAFAVLMTWVFCRSVWRTLLCW